MANELVTDKLWTIIAPHIPIRPRRKYHAGRKPLPDRACLTGIVFVLLSGIPLQRCALRSDTPPQLTF